MKLIVVTALLALCRADKLDRTYLPPASASTAGGAPGSLQTPFKTFNHGLGGLPKGGYSNDFEGVVVDAAAPGTRASGSDETGLGAPRIAYGSTDSKVGEAAFTADAPFGRVSLNTGLKPQGAVGISNNFPQNFESRPERIQSSRDRVSNIVRYENDVSPNKFNYAFETDNGIVAEEVGVEVNGVKAQGGYSYTGDDGQVYSVTYTADQEGYRPKGDHLPTPPPIPAEILESLEKNAQDEAAGIVDDGSYNAAKYNTGEDYTKSDNGQYNGDQPTQLGSRPQSDVVASSSFVNQNNQGFIRPISHQFGSGPSLDSSLNVPSKGIFGTVGSISPSQNGQTFGFGASSQNQYLPPYNAFNQNRKPALSGFQSDLQNGFPVSTSNSNDHSVFNKNKNTGNPLFIPLSQQKLQEDNPKRTQSNSPIFGKPTIIDSTLSIKDPFAKRPSGNRFTQNQQPQKPQSIGGSFEVVSGNVYSSKNEYLPPRRQNKPNQSNGNLNFQGTSSGVQPNQQFINPQNTDLPSVSSFASVSRPSIGFPSPQQIPQHSGNNLFTQGILNSYNRPVNQNQPSNYNSPSSSFSNPPGSQYQYRPSTFASQSPTLQPSTEFTTPLESSAGQNKQPVPVIDGPDSAGLPNSLGSPSVGSQSSNNFLGQSNFNPNKIQEASPTQVTAFVSTLSDQSITPDSQNDPQPGRPGNLGLQSQSNQSPTNGQYSFSTQKPNTQNFNQYTQQQGSDDSYYYNTPSKPFNTPTPRPQASVFPSTSFDQSIKVTQSPFGNRPQGSESTFITPQGTPTDSTIYPRPSTLGPVSPTLPTQQDEQSGNTFQSQFNKVTQAASSFPSPTPTASADFNGNQIGQFDTRPSRPGNQFNKESQGFNNQDSSKPQQQNVGEIYEYKKPEQTLSTPQNGASSSQFGQTSQFGSTLTTSQNSQTVTGYTPSTQFGSKFTQQPFGQRPQSSQTPQENQAFNINSPPQNEQNPGQFNSQPTKPGQPIQGASKFPPTYNNRVSSCCNQIGSSPQSNQSDEPAGSPQFSNQFRPNQDFSQQGSAPGTKPVQSTFPGVGESFEGPREPPSFDKTGYHY